MIIILPVNISLFARAFITKISILISISKDGIKRQNGHDFSLFPKIRNTSKTSDAIDDDETITK